MQFVSEETTSFCHPEPRTEFWRLMRRRCAFGAQWQASSYVAEAGIRRARWHKVAAVQKPQREPLPKT